MIPFNLEVLQGSESSDDPVKMPVRTSFSGPLNSNSHTPGSTGWIIPQSLTSVDLVPAIELLSSKCY